MEAGKSKVGKAFKYFQNEYENLISYLKDPRLEMDNGFVERAIRKFAIGRNNWMFSDTEAGTKASAMFYSLLYSENKWCEHLRCYEIFYLNSYQSQI